MKTFFYSGQKDWIRIFSSISMIAIFLLFWDAPLCCDDRKPETLFIGHFSRGEFDNWEKKVFTGESRYNLVKVDGQTVLKGVAENSASGLLKKYRLDLSQTPFLNWSWRVDKPHPPLDERSKRGDDYAARVYLVVDGGLLFWKTIALNYVWSSSQPAGTSWPSSYAGQNVMLLALGSNSNQLSTWYQEKRNVYEDFKRLFKKEIRYVDAVAIMTDSDNSGGVVLAYYGDIFFSTE